MSDNTTLFHRISKFGTVTIPGLCTVALVLIMVSGCDVPTMVRSLLPSASFHEKFNLRAVDFFDDPQVVKLCEAIEENDLNEMKRRRSRLPLGVSVNTTWRSSF